MPSKETQALYDSMNPETKKDYETAMEELRKLSDEGLKQRRFFGLLEGAVEKDDGRLEVTKGQIRKAKREMRRELAQTSNTRFTKEMNSWLDGQILRRKQELPFST